MEHLHDHASTIWIIIITVCYIIFAIQVSLQVDWKNYEPKAMRAMAALIVVFIFCALSGYLSTLLPEGDLKFWVREIMHFILTLASITLVLTNQAKAIAEALKR